MQFNELLIGQSAKVISYNNNNKAYSQQLMSLGLVPGTIFKISKVAPLGDPVEIEFRGYRLSLRRDEAAIMQVQTL